MKEERIVYADILKIFATFSVILLHVSASKWSLVNIETFEWKVFNFYDSLVRFGVPIFVMLSGMFFLKEDKNISYKKIYSKYILRIFTAFLFWSTFYSIYINFTNYDEFNSEFANKLISDIIEGRYHLWFLFMITGLYIITPILRKVVSNDRGTTEYFLILWFIFTVILPFVIKISNIADLDIFINKFNIHLIIGYVGYFVGGYYMNTFTINKKARKIIYFLGILGIASTVVFTDLISMREGKANAILYGYFSPNVMITSVAVFTFFKYEVSKIRFSKSSLKIINTINSCTFGIYLVHDFFIIVLTEKGITTMLFNPIFLIPIIVLLIFILSFIVSYIISKIPILNKYIM
nr:acyltransferase family protein [Sedimentibacter sp.]